LRRQISPARRRIRSSGWPGSMPTPTLGLGGKVAREHLYWDQGSVLVQVTCWPGGCEAILPLIVRGGDIDIKALGAKFGVRRLGPPLLGG
jgi:hypothetical protein